MTRKTALYAQHMMHGARIVDFGGWDMPLHYGSQIQEHHQVRHNAGLFDVSHMTIVDVCGLNAQAYLRHLLANDVARLKTPGKALYSCMLNESGGVIDDLIVYYFGETDYRVVVNAATRDKDLAWMSRQTLNFDVKLNPRDDLAMLAVQGPQAHAKTLAILESELRARAAALAPFTAAQEGEVLVARTGYTGEDGFELMVPNVQAERFWTALIEAGCQPAGLGARDTLRLEAGMNLYGADMDESTTPLESGLGWTVAWTPPQRTFIGRDALAQGQAQGVARKQVGLVLEDKGVLRAHQKVLGETGEGEITSGTFSPTLGMAIALARVPVDIGKTCQVVLRDKRLPARVVKPPFVRFGQSCLNGEGLLQT